MSGAASSANAVTTRTFSYLPNPGFIGTDTITYNIWDSASAIASSTAAAGTGTIVITVNPAVTEAPATGTTTTLTTSSGSGVLEVAGLGEVTMAGNYSAHTGTGGVVIDGGTLNTPGWSAAVPVAGRHGAVMNASASLTITKLIIG